MSWIKSLVISFNSKKLLGRIYMLPIKQVLTFAYNATPMVYWTDSLSWNTERKLKFIFDSQHNPSSNFYM